MLEWREMVLTKDHLSFTTLYVFDIKIWLEMDIVNVGFLKNDPLFCF